MKEEYKTQRYKEIEEGLSRANGIFELLQTESGKILVDSLRKQVLYNIDVVVHYANAADEKNAMQAISRFSAVLELYKALTKSATEKDTFEKALKDEYEKIQERM